MSGHSKWSQIKHKKSATDVKKGRLFSKLSKEISIAAKEGGGSAELNPKLKAIIEKAKKFNMPSNNIDRAVQKGLGGDETQKMEEIIIEGYGPFKIALIIRVITDNKNRAVSELRHLLSKHGGKLANEGSVRWLFKLLGKIIVGPSRIALADLEMVAIENGAEDTIKEKEGLLVYTKPGELYQIKEALKIAGGEIEETSLDFIPSNIIETSENEKRSLRELFVALDDNDGVQEIYSNMIFS